MKNVTLRAAVLATLVLGLPLAAAQTTTVLQPGGRHDGRLDEGDVRAGEHLSESIRVQAQAGVPIRLEVASQVPQTHVVVVSAKGELVLMPTAASGDLARPSAVEFTPASSGEHFVTVSGKGRGAFAVAWPNAGTAASEAATANAAEANAVDPVWGQYAGLVGVNARGGTDGYEVRWYWAVPGKELVQEYIVPTTKAVAHRDVIRPGATPGSLVLTSSMLGKKQWLGTVQPDGRVLFIGKGLLKLPYLAGRTSDGAWQLSRVDLKDGRVVDEKPVSEYARFVPFDASNNPAAQLASAPASSAAAMVAGAAMQAGTAPAVAASAPAPAPAAVSAPAPAMTPETPEVALLRSVIEGLRSGTLPYERMEPKTADALRKQMSTLAPQWADVDETRWIEANWPMKPYRFLSMQGETAIEWRMDLSSAGRIAGINYRPVSPEHVAAVRNFGSVAALAGKQFVAHTTRASFALEAGGNAMVMNGNWGPLRLQRNAAGGLDVIAGPGHNASKAVATLEPDGTLSLELSYRGGLTRQTGTRRHRISASPDGSGFSEVQHWRNGGMTLVGRSYEWQADHRFVPLNDENVARQQRYAAQARAERARQRAEEQASRDAAFAGFMGGLQEAAYQYEEQQEQTRQFNAQLEHTARVAQERRRLEEESRRRQAEAQAPATGQHRTAASAPSQPPVPASSRSSGANGSTATPSGTTGSSPTTRTTSTTRAPAVSTPSPASDKPACRMLPGKTVTQRSIPLSSREAAENHVRVGSRGACPRAYGKGSLGSITCTTESEPIITVDSKGRTQRTGSRTMYTCSAPVTCPPVEHCDSRPSGASAQ